MTRFVVFVFVFTLVVALALVLLRGVLSAAAVVAFKLATLGADREQEQSGGEQMHEGAMPSCCSVHPSPRLWVATLVWQALALAGSLGLAVALPLAVRTCCRRSPDSGHCHTRLPGYAGFKNVRTSPVLLVFFLNI